MKQSAFWSGFALDAAFLFTLTVSAGAAEDAWKPSVTQDAAAAINIRIGPKVPFDILPSARDADLTTAAVFAWEEFIALNWPARAGVRETPEDTLPFGFAAAAGGPPLVWETLRHKIEIFPPREASNITNPLPAPHGSELGPPNYGFDAPPAYYYSPSQTGTSDGSIPACPGQLPVQQAPWINVDETTQIGLDQLFAGVVPNTPGANSSPQLIRFMAKGNRVQYLYSIKENYWYHSVALSIAEQNFQDGVAKNEVPQLPIVFFPPGTIEVKSAWRPLGPTEDKSRFHTTTVRFYEQSKKSSRPCYFEAEWALVALHIIQKTPTAPAFVFATFEQADNILSRDGKLVEDTEGRIVIPQTGAPTEPELTYADSPVAPKVSVANGQNYCEGNEIGERLFYLDQESNLPTGGHVCVKRRFNAIPKTIIDVNIAAHRAIEEYNRANGVQNSPWEYYKLVNVQAYPFDKADIDRKDPGSKHNPSTFYQANSVVETNYTLQNFSGRLSGGASTDFPTGRPGFDFKNTHINNFRKPEVESFNMGGCQGCHANAQLGGTDFSFILDGNSFQTAPDTPAAQSVADAVEKYRRRFLLGR